MFSCLMPFFIHDANSMTPEEQWEAKLVEAQERYKLKVKKRKDAKKKPKLIKTSTDAQEWIRRQKEELSKLRGEQSKPFFHACSPWKSVK